MDIQESIDFINKSHVFVFIATENIVEEMKYFFFSIEEVKRFMVVYFVDDNLSALGAFSEHMLEDFFCFIRRYPDRIKISQSTSSTDNQYLHPYINLSNWYDRFKIPNTSLKPSFSVLNDIDYNISQKFTKNIDLWLSIRRKSSTRDCIFDKIKKTNTNRSIINYAEGFYNTDNQMDYLSNYYSDEEIFSQQRRSMIIGVVESEDILFLEESDNTFNSMTEKTMMSFLHQSMPILHGGVNYIQEIENLGFYTFNSEFGYNLDVDRYQWNNTKKIDEYTHTINNVLSMSSKEIRDIYQKNYDKIYKNYKLIHEIILQGKYSIFNNINCEKRVGLPMLLSLDYLPEKTIL